MLMDELMKAWKSAAAGFNTRLVERARAAGHIVYGTVSEDLKPWEYEFLLTLYSRREFDATCGGSDRHEVFAAWAVDHYAAWERITNREYLTLFDRVHDAAAHHWQFTV